MANPVTSIINPRGDRILLYSVNSDQQLALTQAPLDSKLQDLSYESNDTPVGNHATNQGIAAVYLRGMPTVYGKILKDQKLVLAQLSPITNMVARPGKAQEATTTDLPAFAGVSDGEDRAWFYFMKRPSPDSAAVLTETALAFDTAKTRTVIELPEPQMPGENSRLAALYIHDKIQVFYQKKLNGDNQLYCLTVGEHTSPQVIDGTESAQDGTSIAVTQTESGTVHLYWMSSNGDIQRATRTADTWKISTADMTKFTVKKMQKESQITVTHTNKGGVLQNHVFYINFGASDYEDHIDTKV